MPWLVLAVGCVEPGSPDPTDVPPGAPTADTAVAHSGHSGHSGHPPTPDTAPRPPTLDLGPEHLWSAAGTRGFQHHATVAVLPDGSGAVAFTDGPALRVGHASLVAPLDAGGTVGAAWPLGGGVELAKPDVVGDGPGTALTGSQSLADGLWLERTDLTTGAATRAELAPFALAGGENQSVDLARREDGSVVAVWYTSEGPIGAFRIRAFDPSLALDPRLDLELGRVLDVADPAPDVDVDASGDAAVLWTDQDGPRGDPEALVFQRLAPDGREVARVTVDEGEGSTSPRRPTIAAVPGGGWVAAWRERGSEPRPTTTRFVALDPLGAPRGEQLAPEAGDTDDLVVATVDADLAWLAWTRVEDDSGLGTIRGALVALPGGEPVIGPLDLSASAVAARPHTAVGPAPGGGFTVVVSWEEGPVEATTVRGRVGQLRR